MSSGSAAVAVGLSRSGRFRDRGRGPRRTSPLSRRPRGASPTARRAPSPASPRRHAATATATVDPERPAVLRRGAEPVARPTGAAWPRTRARRPACPSASARSAPRRAARRRAVAARRGARARSGPRPSPPRPSAEPPPPALGEQLARLELAQHAARRALPAVARAPRRRARRTRHGRLDPHPLLRVHDLLGRGRRARALGEVHERPAPAGALAQRLDERRAAGVGEHELRLQEGRQRAVSRERAAEHAAERLLGREVAPRVGVHQLRRACPRPAPAAPAPRRRCRPGPRGRARSAGPRARA